MTGGIIAFGWIHADFHVNDPGNAKIIDFGKKGYAFCPIRTAGAETRTVPAPSRLGQRACLFMDVDGGDATITVTNGQGVTTIVFSDAGDFSILECILVGGTKKWRVTAASGLATGYIPREDLAQETGTYTIALTSLRVHDALQTNLPGTAANDDMGLITGTQGTDSPTLQGVDFAGTSTDEKGAFEFILPPEYVSGGAITVRVRGGMLTAVSDGTATVDVECWLAGEDGAAGSDICATAAQSINSLTFANKDFTITPTGLVAGDRLQIRLSFAGSDVGNLAVMIPEISKLQVLCAIKG